MSENEKKILEMLANKKIRVDEAYRLLCALKTEARTPEDTAEPETMRKPKPKYLHVTVGPSPGHEQDEDTDRVNVRVPISLIRSGIKLSSLIPHGARDKVTGALHEKGIDLDMRNLKPEDLEPIIEALEGLQVDVVSDEEAVKIFVE